MSGGTRLATHSRLNPEKPGSDYDHTWAPTPGAHAGGFQTEPGVGGSGTGMDGSGIDACV